MNLPTSLTWMRIAFIPLILLFYFLPFPHMHFVAAVFFGVAAITDFLDGFLARKMKIQSGFGAFLDPVADKLLVTIILVALLVNIHNPLFVLCAMVIIGREITVSAMREWLGQVGGQVVLPVSYLGKIKTTLQLFGIALLVWSSAQTSPAIFYSGLFFLIIASALTIWSMVLYIKIAMPDLTLSQDKE